MLSDSRRSERQIEVGTDLEDDFVQRLNLGTTCERGARRLPAAVVLAPPFTRRQQSVHGPESAQDSLDDVGEEASSCEFARVEAGVVDRHVHADD
jgi:hypothetical protein